MEALRAALPPLIAASRALQPTGALAAEAARALLATVGDKQRKFGAKCSVLRDAFQDDLDVEDVSVPVTVDIIRCLGVGDAGLRMAAVALLYALRNGTRPLADGDLSQRGQEAVRDLLLDALNNRIPLDPKVLLRVAQKFPMVHPSLLDAALIHVLRLLRQDPATAAGLAVALHLLNDPSEQCVTWATRHSSECLEALAASGLWDAAEALVDSAAPPLRKSLATTLIPLLLDAKQYKQAARCTAHWGLRGKFPEAEYLNRRHCMQKFLRKGLWKFAEDRANTRQLRVELLGMLLEANQFTLVSELREKFELQNEVPPIDEAVIAREREAHRLRYLQLPLPPEAVVLVDDPGALRDTHGPAFLAAVRRGDPLVVGLDVEWRPTRKPFPKTQSLDFDKLATEADPEDNGSPGDDDIFPSAAPASSPSTTSSGKSKKPRVRGREQAALLQLACREMVILLDLPLLCSTQEGCAAMGSLIQAVFWDDAITKLGLGISHDLAVLHASWPHVPGFARCLRILEIGDFGATVQYNGFGKGLSAATELWLGKPLDKSQQVSDWESRPLTEAQILYAALDAWCSCAVFDSILAAAATTPGPGRPVVASPAALEDLARSTFWFPLCTDFVAVSVGGEALREEPIGAIDETATPLGPEHVRRCIDAMIPDRAAEATQLASPIPPPDAIAANSIAFLAEDIPVVVVLPAHRRVDLNRLAVALGRPRRSVRFARREECVPLFGHAPGSMPPVGHRHRTTVLLDRSLIPPDIPDDVPICVSGGAPDVMLCFSFDLLKALIGDRVVAVAEADQDSCTAPTPEDGPSPEEGMDTPPRSNHDLAFCVDSMFGKVGRWLRAIGCDVERVDARETDGQIALLQRCANEGRILITADRKLASRRTPGQVFFIAAKDPQVQFSEVCRQFNIRFNEADFLSRCTACNGIGYYVLTTDEARRRNVCLESTLERVMEFFACKTCDKVYWYGPRSATIVEKFATMFEENGSIRPLPSLA